MANSCCLIIPNSKNGASDPYEGTALFNGDSIVIRHAHGDLFELLMIRKEVCLKGLENIVQVPEFAAHLIHVLREGGHAHHPADADVLQSREDLSLKHGAALLYGETELGLFCRDVKLKQAGDHALVFSSQLVDFHQQRFAVNAVNHSHIGGNVFDFVGLQMTDKVPLDILRQHLVFGLHLLGLVLSEQPLALVIQHLDILHRFGFGDGNQPSAFGQLALNLMVFFYIHDDNDTETIKRAKVHK